MRLFVATVFWVLMLKEIKNHMKFLDLFAGIGGFRLGMESAGHECVDFYNKITKDEVGTLTSSGGGSTVRAGSFGITDGYRIRKLTPRECWRLQGFPDWAFDKAQKVNSNSQLYKQAGNSVTVSVIAAIAKELE